MDVSGGRTGGSTSSRSPSGKHHTFPTFLSELRLDTECELDPSNDTKAGQHYGELPWQSKQPGGGFRRKPELRLSG